MRQYADIYLLLNYSTCFGRPSRPSSGVHKTIVAASGRDHTIWRTRLCQKFDETIDHIISACPVLAKEQYIKRHDTVCAQIHFNICKETGVQLDKKQWFEHVPKSVETSQGGKVTVLWHQQVQPDRTIPKLACLFPR